MLSKDTVDRVAALLGIVKDIAGVAPGFMSISGEAMAELREIDKEIRERAPKPDSTVPPGMPSSAPPVPSQPVGPRAVPSSSFAEFNSSPDLLSKRLLTGSTEIDNGEI